MRFHYTLTTQKSVSDVIASLTDNLKGIGFGVLEILDFKKILNVETRNFKMNTS